MRRIKLLIVTSILSVSLYGCSNKNDFSNSTNQNNLSYIVENYDYYKNGVVYGKTTAAFLDFDTMESSILCPVPNCTHQSSDCLAKKVGNTPVFYNDNIYYFISNNGEVKETTKGKIFSIDSKLMKISINSLTAEEVCTFHDCAPPSDFSTYVLFNNELYFIGDDMGVEEDSYGGFSWGNTGGTHCLCSINLDNGKYMNYGSIYDGDKQFEAAAYSSQSTILGVYKGKMYIGYTYVEDMDELNTGLFEFTYKNFEFDFKSKTLSEANLPYSNYMNSNTYTYYDKDNKQIHIIHNETESTIPYDYAVRDCSEFNGKFFMHHEGKWFDLIDNSEHSLGKYKDYKVVGYEDDSYIFLNGGRSKKVSENDLLSLDKE